MSRHGDDPGTARRPTRGPGGIARPDGVDDLVTQQPPPTGWGQPAAGHPVWSAPEQDGQAQQPPGANPTEPANPQGQVDQAGQGTAQASRQPAPGPSPAPAAAGPAPAGAEASATGGSNGWGGPPAAGWQQLSGSQPPPYGSVVTRRGIIALKPLGFGDYFDGAFRAIRHNPRVMLGVTAIVLGITTILVALPYVGFFASFADFALDPEAAAEPTGGDLALLLTSSAGLLVASLVQAAGVIVLNGLLMLSVTQSVLDRRMTLGELWRRARGRLPLLVVQALMLSVGATLLVLLALSPGIVLAAAGELVAGGLALVVLTLAAFALVVWLGIMWVLAPAALVVERAGVIASLGRSYQLVRGAFWKTLAVFLLASILTSTVASVVSFPISAVAGVVAALFPENALVVGIAQGTGLTLATLAGNILAVPFLAAVVALLYVDRRIRREGLDVVLNRAFDGGPA